MGLVPHREVRAALWDRFFPSSEGLLVVGVWRVTRTGLGEQDLNIKIACRLLLSQIQQEQKRSKFKHDLGCPDPQVLISASNIFCHWDW